MAMARLRPYTVVGYYTDNDQVFVEHVRATNPRHAVAVVHHMDESDDLQRAVVEVFARHRFGLGGLNTVDIG